MRNPMPFIISCALMALASASVQSQLLPLAQRMINTPSNQHDTARSLALNATGTTLLIGGNYLTTNSTGLVWQRGAGGFAFQIELRPPLQSAPFDHGRGEQVAISGETAVIGAPLFPNPAGFAAGTAFVFVRNGTTWASQAQLFGDDGAGSIQADADFAGALAIDGNTIAVGAPARARITCAAIEYAGNVILLHCQQTPTMTVKPLTLSISLLLSINALADEAKKLDEIIVRSSPLKESATHMTKPAEVLADAALDRARSGTLGETLRGLAGVQSTQFGQAVSRPILRGLDGGRVLMAQGGVSSMDVSTVSVDHAVSVEPFLADQIEVLKGPASLFYGTGAIGGVVNVEDGRLPETLPEQINGRMQLEYGSVADESNVVARADGALGSFAWHADAFRRDADAYDTPIGIVENSALETRGAALGSTWISDAAHLGLAISRYETNYGIPNEEALLDLGQTRIDAHGGVEFDGMISEIEFRAGINNYRHLELEGSEIGTRFDNDEAHLRLDAAHEAIAGWNGVFGISGERRETVAIGEEAFIPPSTTRDIGLFLVEQKQGEVYDFTAGLRFDRNRVEANQTSRSFQTPSASISAAQHVNEQHTLVASFDFATRAPLAEELFSNGPHAATQNFEIGDEQLKTERARSVNLGWRMVTERLDLKLDFYHTRFARFIYLQPTDLLEDDLPVFQWQQQDARFSGFDFSGNYRLWQEQANSLAIGVLADRVGAQFADGTAIPRLSPRRLGLNAQWESEQWRFAMQALRYAKPSRLASFETSTKGFYQLDADLSYRLPVGEQNVEVYLQGKNLTNQLARLHTSFLKDSVPLPGRNIKFGVRYFF